MGLFQPHGGYRRRDGEAAVISLVPRTQHFAKRRAAKPGPQQNNSSSCAGLTRASILFARVFRKGWIAGSSPAMTLRFVAVPALRYTAEEAPHRVRDT